MIHLSSHEDMVKAWTRESHIIDSSLFRLFRWSPDFNPRYESSLSAVWIRLPYLPLNESRSSQRSGLGSGIPSLVGAFGSKVLKCGAGSSLSTSSGSREGDRGDPDFRSLLYGGRSLSYQECFGEAREDGLDREAMLIPLLYR